MTSLLPKTSPLLVVLALAQAGTAHAAGVEETVSGGVALGRAANYGRANDFMAVMQNPANLAIVPGADLGGELRLPIFRACFDRAFDQSLSYKLPSDTYDGDEYFGNVCNEAKPFPTGNLGWAQSFATGARTGWGYGVGFYTPPGVSSYKYGKDTLVTLMPRDEELPITESGLEYPNRQLLLERRALLGWLMAGAGWQPIPKLRFGASFGLGFATIHNKNVASVQPGRLDDYEVLNDLKVADWFVPRATLSAVASLTDSLDVFGVLTYVDDIKGKGTLDLTANGIKGAPRNDCRSESPGPNCRVNDVTLTVPMPTWEITLGVRYASLRGDKKRVIDPMKDEKWDVSLEGFWSKTSHVDAYRVGIWKDGDENPPRIAFSSEEGSAALATPRRAIIDRQWRDTYGFRLGGDWNVLPEQLAVRMGVSYSSSAVPPAYANIDVFPVSKFGLHAGLTYQLGRQRVTLAYAHIFYSDVTVPVGAGRVREIAPETAGADGKLIPANAINEGFFQASMDIVSIQTNIRF